MKKLAVIVDTFPRWSERFIARELQELLRRSADLTVFCLKAGDTMPPEDEDWRGLADRRVVLPSGLVPKSARGLTPATRGRWEQARPLFGRTGYRMLGRALALRDALRKGGFGHVHAHFASLPSTLAWLATADTDLPFSFSAHARDVFIEPQIIEQKLAACVRAFTCHARAHEHLLAKTDYKDKVRLMRHGLPLDQFFFKLGGASAGLNILAAGRFIPKKGFDVLLDAAAQPELADRDFTMTFLGDGPGRKALVSKIAKLKLRSNVRIQEPAAGDALTSIFDDAAIFVAPYRTAPDGDADGVPNVVLEAFARGIPVVGTDAGSLPEVLVPDTGAVVPQNDPAALAQAIVTVANMPEIGFNKSRNARTLVEQDYDIQKNIEPLWELLQNKTSAS